VIQVFARILPSSGDTASEEATDRFLLFAINIGLPEQQAAAFSDPQA
jgi:hypothetical protein